MMTKIIFLDVDGTLVDYHNRIPESAIRAIRQARGNGHLVYVCTGRSRKVKASVFRRWLVMWAYIPCSNYPFDGWL